MADANDLRLRADFDDKASPKVRRLGKTLSEVRPSSGMMAAQKWMGQFRADADKVGVAVRPITTGLSAMGVGGLAASLSLAEIVKQFRELADSTATMKELGRQAGMTTTQIAQLQYAAGKLHVDPSAMSGAIDAWSGKMVEFRRHTGRFYFELLRNNHYVAQKIAADSPVQGLKDTLDFLSRIKDPQVQKRWAEEMGLGDVVPMLAKGPNGLADAFSEASREVKPITSELEQQAEALNQSLNRFDQTWATFKREVGPTVLNGLTATVDKLDQLFKLVQAHPAETGVAAGGFAAIYARHRIMQRLNGGASGIAMTRAAGALTGAGGGLDKAGITLVEAGIELKAAAAALRMRGGPAPGGVSPGSPEGSEAAPEKTGKPGGGYSLGNLARGALMGFNLWQLVGDMPEQLKQRETDTSPEDPMVTRAAGWGDAIRSFFKGGEPKLDEDRLTRARSSGIAIPDTGPTNTDGNALHRNDEMPIGQSRIRFRDLVGALDLISPAHAEDAPARAVPDEDRLTRARYSELIRREPDRETRATNTDGNALRRNDEMPAAITAQNLYATIRDGSKEGIVQGLRELAQQQELGGGAGGGGFGGGGPSVNAGHGAMLGRGARNLRYGRPSASGSYRGTPIPDAPYNGKNIDGLGEGASKQYASILGNRESGNRYGIANSYGYAGRWQFGASALAENGYVKPGTTNAGLRDPASWTGKGGATSLNDWLANKGGVQDQAFGEYTNRHYAQLKAAGVIRDGMSQPEIAGWLAAAHLKGVGGAIALSRGRDSTDANGTSAGSYRRMMQGVGLNPKPTAQAPVPAGASPQAIGDAAVFAARQHIAAGSRDPKDKAIVDQYLKEHHFPGSPHAELERLRKLPDITKLTRGGSGDSDKPISHEIDPVEINIRHHPSGRTSVAARGGKGTKLALRTGPTMQMV